MGSLAQAWQCDASNVTWMVDRLEQRGLVERRPVPADRRVKAIALTPEGVKTKERLLERLHQPPVDFLAVDRATLEQLRDVLDRLPASVRQASRPRPASPPPDQREP
jgi:DNA-binding MarR family transcriptional regulator